MRGLKQGIIGILIGFTCLPVVAQDWAITGVGLRSQSTNTAFFTVRSLFADTVRNILLAGGNIRQANGDIIHLYGLIDGS